MASNQSTQQSKLAESGPHRAYARGLLVRADRRSGVDLARGFGLDAEAR
jgi:hypothetical protein